jgi:acetyl esterase
MRSLSELTVAEARAQEQAALRSRVVELEPVHEVRDLAIPDPAGPLPARAYLPGGLTRPAPVLVWFPGGGWVLGSLEAADAVCRKLATETPCAVVAVEYRQAPKHPFPAAVEDCLAATRWVASEAPRLGLDPARVSIGGASAGGNLAAVVAHLARDRRGPPLVIQLLVYPLTDRRARGDVISRDPNEPTFSRADASWCWSHYLGDASGDDPRASPLRSGSFRDLPPALVITARDALQEEAELYAEKLEAAGVEVEHAHYDASHGFFSTPGSTVSDDARGRAVAALRRVFGKDMAGSAK